MLGEGEAAAAIGQFRLRVGPTEARSEGDTGCTWAMRSSRSTNGRRLARRCSREEVGRRETRSRQITHKPSTQAGKLGVARIWGQPRRRS